MGLLAGLVLITAVAGSKALWPLTDFYDIPESFVASGKSGDLIRSMVFDGYELPQGVKAIRILYGSKNSQGDLVACSGVVLVPQGDPPEDGWPVIAWAHGTSGVNRKCAPSLMAECFSDYEAPCIYTEKGYAVVAADYAGLGTDYPVDYMDRVSNGLDVINSVKAARKAVPELSRKWVAAGHSAGAHAVRGVAELQAGIHDPFYLGGVAASGLGNARTPMVVLSEMAWRLALCVGVAVKSRYPQFDYADMFTEKGLELLDDARTTCQGPGAGMPNSPIFRGSHVLKKDWHFNPYIDKYFKMDESGKEKYEGPILVLIGENEPPPAKANDIEAAKRMCDQGVKVQLKIVPDANHFNLLAESIEDQLDWIADRFAGKEAPQNCETILKK